MAQILIIKHIFLYYSVVIGIFPIIGQISVKATPSLGLLSTVIVLVLMLVTLLPELLLINKDYRKQMILGIQDGDGVLNKSDLKDFISWYMPFSALRVLIFFSLFSMVEDWEPPTALIWSLVSIGLGTAVPQIGRLIKGKE